MLVAATILISELASNVATLTSMLPVVAAVRGDGTPASAARLPGCARGEFCVHAACRHRAERNLYSSGMLTLKRMLAVGVGLNIAAAALIIAFAAAA